MPGTPPSSDLLPCHHLALSPVQTALGTSSTRRSLCPALIPTVCRKTDPLFARNRPISFAVNHRGEYLGFPFIYPCLFCLSTRTHLRGMLTSTIRLCFSLEVALSLPASFNHSRWRQPRPATHPTLELHQTRYSTASQPCNRVSPQLFLEYGEYRTVESSRTVKICSTLIAGMLLNHKYVSPLCSATTQ